MKIIALILFTFCVIGCTDSADFEKGKMQLQSQGYTEIIDTGYSLFCCGDSDDFSTGFEAKDKNGNLVKGCICSGFLKGITIRFE
jgi:hypothetical protein